MSAQLTQLSHQGNKPLTVAIISEIKHNSCTGLI